MELLENYKGVLCAPMIDYLNSLIELEFSVVKEYLREDDRKILMELEIYRRIAIYNIYNRALKLFNENNFKYKFSGNESGLESLTISVLLDDNNSVNVFNFDYKRVFSIGDILLHQSLESKELREAELMRVLAILEGLYGEKNPYRSKAHTYGGPAPQWPFEHNNKIAMYEKKFKQLDGKKELSDIEKKECEITKKVYELFLTDYDLAEKDFIETTQHHPFKSQESKMQKTFVKKQPGLTITSNKKYI